MGRNSGLLLVALLAPVVLFGQGKIPLSISVFNESTALPFTRFFTAPIHPGIQAGTEFDYRDKNSSRLFQTANICYFFHNHLAQGIGLSTEFGYEYRLKFGLAIEGLLGVGYMHTFTTAEEFTFSNGHYEQKADGGNARLYPSLTLGVGYYVKKSEPSSPKIFIRYQAWAEYPYSPDFIPVMTHISLHLGAKFYVGKKRKNE